MLMNKEKKYWDAITSWRHPLLFQFVGHMCTVHKSSEKSIVQVGRLITVDSLHSPCEKNLFNIVFDFMIEFNSINSALHNPDLFVLWNRLG